MGNYTCPPLSCFLIYLTNYLDRDTGQMLLQAPSWELRSRTSQGLRARVSEVPVSSRLVPSEQHCFLPAKPPPLNHTWKETFKGSIRLPHTLSQRKQSSCPRHLLSTPHRRLTQRRWFGGTETEGRMEGGGLSDNGALSCQKEFSSDDLLPVCGW